MRLARLAIPAATGATLYGAARAALLARPPGGRARWVRTNYAGRETSLLGGVAAASAALLTPGLAAVAHPGAPGAPAAALAAGGAGVLGAVDDLAADGAHKGLHGHLTALRGGQVTTGLVKLVGIGAAGLVAGYRLRDDGGPVRTLTGGALVAGAANLANLLDLRPGRALKAIALGAAPLAVVPGPSAGRSARLAAGALGVSLAALPDDLAERTMLGDAGANALGALLGAAVAAHPSAAVRHTVLAGIVGLTLASERVSFSRVLATTPVLRELDAWGRRAS